MSVRLYLDGVLMPIKGIIGKVSMEVKGRDWSNRSSSTFSADKGTKAKKLKYSGVCSSLDDLKVIYEASIKWDENGKRHVYRINQNTANAVQVRQVKFQGEIRNDGNNISIELIEVLSVPERKEQRLPDKPPAYVQEYGSGFVTEPNGNNKEKNIPPSVNINLDKFIKKNGEK